MIQQNDIIKFLKSEYPNMQEQPTQRVQKIIEHVAEYEQKTQKEALKFSESDWKDLFLNFRWTRYQTFYPNRSVIRKYLDYIVFRDGRADARGQITLMDLKPTAFSTSQSDEKKSMLDASYFASENEFVQMLNQALTDPKHVRAKALFALYWIGLDKEAALALTVEDALSGRLKHADRLSPDLWVWVKAACDAADGQEYIFCYERKGNKEARAKTSLINFLLREANQELASVGKKIRQSTLKANGEYCRNFAKEQSGIPLDESKWTRGQKSGYHEWRTWIQANNG